MTEVKKPKASNSLAEQEMNKAEAQIEHFENSVKDLTLDRMNLAPKEDSLQQTNLSQQDIAKSKDIYLKPTRSIGSREKFNEKYRKDYEMAKEYVQFIYENKEIIGEKGEIWTKPFPGLPAEMWTIPCNVPVWGPRYLQEQIDSKCYHRMKTEDRPIGTEPGMQYYGQMVVDTTVERLTARPVTKRRSLFIGAPNFR